MKRPSDQPGFAVCFQRSLFRRRRTAGPGRPARSIRPFACNSRFVSAPRARTLPAEHGFPRSYCFGMANSAKVPRRRWIFCSQRCRGCDRRFFGFKFPVQPVQGTQRHQCSQHQRADGRDQRPFLSRLVIRHTVLQKIAPNRSQPAIAIRAAWRPLLCRSGIRPRYPASRPRSKRDGCQQRSRPRRHARS
jgi:hypothetical protein